MTTTTARRTAARSLTRHLPTVGRIVMGLLFFVTGLNGFLNFLPQDASGMPAEALAFSVALAQTGYMLPLTMGVQLVSGVLLLANRFVPLALALLAPVVVNIFAFHVFLAPDGPGRRRGGGGAGDRPGLGAPRRVPGDAPRHPCVIAPATPGGTCRGALSLAERIGTLSSSG